MGLVIAGLLAPPAVRAQRLEPKLDLGGTRVTGCAFLPLHPARADTGAAADTTGDVQALVEEAQEAAMQGEHAAARDKFLRATRAAPGDARLAYYLGRELEALRDALGAVQQYCRFLALAPGASEGNEVRGRITKLTPPREVARVDDARTLIRTGAALLARGDYDAADSMLTLAAQLVPDAPEPVWNRALARGARGDRSSALRDAVRYAQLAPSAPDAIRLRSALSALPTHVYSTGTAFTTGLVIPGLGQATTGRPLLGVLAFGAFAGAMVYALQWHRVPDASGMLVTEHPNAAVGYPVAGAIWLGAAIEAAMHARGSHSRASTLVAPMPRSVGLRLVPANGRVQLGLALPTR